MRPLRLSLLAGLVALAGCDDTPGVTDPFGAPPAVASFSLTPDSFTASGTDATVDVPLSIRVGLVGGEGQVTVRALVRDLDGDEVVAEESVTQAAASPGEAVLTPTLTLPRGAIGDYEVTLTTEDASGRAGDRASALFRFSADSLGPPVVASTNADPMVITRPSSGSATLTLSAAVTDPDGLPNVARVELREPASVGGTTLFRLRDDGTGGDATADDGTYAVRLALSGAVEPGEYGFEIVATDRFGDESAPTAVTFTVQ